jgi:hypothetical protein
MAQTTTYTCDRCGVLKVEAPKFLTEVKIVTAAHWSRDGYRSLAIPPQMWCDDCLIATGLIHPGNVSRPASEAPAVAPTLEEVIRQIVREEVEAAQQ